MERGSPHDWGTGEGLETGTAGHFTIAENLDAGFRYRI